ncbi:MAG: hypothetical protein N2112_08635 [Gemmataceae bacterium]|jgi:hypothetical protein|nr:hypothetical protein [Gemmataceae bacterium]
MNSFIYLLLLCLFSQLNKKIEIDDEQLKKIENGLINRVKSIEKYDMTVSIQFNNHSDEWAIGNTIRICKDKEKLLADKTITMTGMRELFCQNGDFTGYTLTFVGFNSGDNDPAKYVEGNHFDSHCYVPAHMIGIGYAQLIPSTRVPDDENYINFIRDLFQKEFISEAKFEEFDGTKCLKLSTLKNGTMNTVWIDINRGPNFLKGEIRLPNQSKIWFVNSLQNHKGHWFPKTRDYFIEDKNGKLKQSEKVSVVIHSLNEEIDPKNFTIESLKLPQGTKILNSPAAKFNIVVNDQNKVVPVDAYGKPEPEPKESSKWWGRVAVAACVLTLIFGFIYLRQRRLKAKST